MAAGCVSRAIFSTHLRRCLFLLSGIARSRPVAAGPACFEAGSLSSRRIRMSGFLLFNRHDSSMPSRGGVLSSGRPHRPRNGGGIAMSRALWASITASHWPSGETSSRSPALPEFRTSVASSAPVAASQIVIVVDKAITRRPSGVNATSPKGSLDAFLERIDRQLCGTSGRFPGHVV